VVVLDQSHMQPPECLACAPRKPEPIPDEDRGGFWWRSHGKRRYPPETAMRPRICDLLVGAISSAGSSGGGVGAQIHVT
jgi:hypothetical protein